MVRMLMAWVAVAGCVVPEDRAERELAAPLLSPGGQGQDYQGVDYDGLDYQGLDYQGTSFGDASLADGSVVDTALVAWRSLGPNREWEQRFPDRICTWDPYRQVQLYCTPVVLKTTPSPLAGSRWPATFVADDGTETAVVMQIGASASALDAVRRDTSSAMHPLAGNTTLCTVVPFGPTCGHPNGCRVNCDLWLYDVRVEKPAGLVPLCPAGNLAYALAGTWSPTGARSLQAGRFTFACANGTIAKCTRWGYRPFGSARKCGDTGCSQDEPLEPLADYHQACVRAATADYCANGHSHTRNGTLVDIYDYRPHQPGTKGFIPSTWSLENRANRLATALGRESTFDVFGAYRVEELRHFGALGTLNDPETGCPGDFSDPVYGFEGQVLQVRERFAPAATTPAVEIDSTPLCAHSEHVVGTPLHWNCDFCTYKLFASLNPAYTKCWSERWDADCVAATTTQGAPAWCSGTERMTKHSECEAGDKLYRYASGCTLRVCLDLPECCSANWKPSCVAAANARCTGGQEDPSVLRGFCGHRL